MPKDYSMTGFFASIDAVIMGRKTYEVSLKLGGGAGFEGAEAYVFSKTLPSGTRNGMTFLKSSPKALIERLAKRKGKNIWLMGGGELAREFLKADLVDELYLGVVPVLLGDGIPLFPAGFPQLDFELTETRTFSQGLITLEYQRVRRRRKPPGRK